MRTQNQKKRYTFDHVFSSDASQSDVFHAVGLPVLHEVLRGYDALYPGIQAITIWAITICAITILDHRYNSSILAYGHNYMGHNYTGHNYTGHNYMDHS